MAFTAAIVTFTINDWMMCRVSACSDMAEHEYRRAARSRVADDGGGNELAVRRSVSECSAIVGTPTNDASVAERCAGVGSTGAYGDRVLEAAHAHERRLGASCIRARGSVSEL